MNVTNEKVLEVIKNLPMFQDLLQKTAEVENLRAQRRVDISGLKILKENRRAQISERAVILEASIKNVRACEEALRAAREKQSAINRKCIAEDFQYETQLATVENRLRQSCPQWIYDRIEEIDKELDRLYGTKTFSSEMDLLRAKNDSVEYKAAVARAEELRKERDQLNRKIYDDYGYSEEEEDHAAI